MLVVPPKVVTADTQRRERSLVVGCCVFSPTHALLLACTPLVEIVSIDTKGKVHQGHHHKACDIRFYAQRVYDSHVLRRMTFCQRHGLPSSKCASPLPHDLRKTRKGKSKNNTRSAEGQKPTYSNTSHTRGLIPDEPTTARAVFAAAAVLKTTTAGLTTSVTTTGCGGRKVAKRWSV